MIAEPCLAISAFVAVAAMPLPALPSLPLPALPLAPAVWQSEYEQNMAKLQREMAHMFFRDFPTTEPKHFGAQVFAFHVLAGILGIMYSATVRHDWIQLWWKTAGGGKRYTANKCKRQGAPFCTPAPVPFVEGSAGHPMLGLVVGMLVLLMIVHGYSLPWVKD